MPSAVDINFNYMGIDKDVQRCGGSLHCGSFRRERIALDAVEHVAAIARNAAVSIPDMDPDSPDSAAAARLYQAGVLTGVDTVGNFAPDAPLTRAQAAVIFARILDPDLRVTE